LEAATFTVQWQAQLTLLSRPAAMFWKAPTLFGVACACARSLPLKA
jgi:hypothetical protein